MPFTVPTITVGTSPVISVTSTGTVSYDTINNSIGSYAYLLGNIYIYSSNDLQLNYPIVLKKYNKFGDKNNIVLQPMIDPYQANSSLNQSMIGYDYAFDSNNGFYPMIKANTSVNYQIEYTQISASDYLKGGDNFSDIEFLEDYIVDF